MADQIRIALVGKKKAGRSFIGVHLRKKHSFRNWGLIDGVDRIYRMLYDFHQYEKIAWEKQREVYDYFYAQDNEIWTKFFERRITKSDRNIVCDDVRYIPEVQYLKKIGFVIVRVTAPEDQRQLNIAKQLGKTVEPGATVIYEYFNKDHTEPYQVDYSIHSVNRQQTRESVDLLIKNLTKA